MKIVLFFLLLLPWGALCTPAPVASQENAAAPAPLESFVLQVARLWAVGDAAALVDLAPADGRILIDIGTEAAGSVQGRHATAALRALFAGRENVTIRPTRVTIAGGRPMRGFGELSWVSRTRGITVPQAVTLYVGTVWEENGWRIREIRILP